MNRCWQIPPQTCQKSVLLPRELVLAAVDRLRPLWNEDHPQRSRRVVRLLMLTWASPPGRIGHATGSGRAARRLLQQPLRHQEVLCSGPRRSFVPACPAPPLAFAAAGTPSRCAGPDREEPQAAGSPSWSGGDDPLLVLAEQGRPLLAQLAFEVGVARLMDLCAAEQPGFARTGPGASRSGRWCGSCGQAAQDHLAGLLLDLVPQERHSPRPAR